MERNGNKKELDNVASTKEQSEDNERTEWTNLGRKTGTVWKEKNVSSIGGGKCDPSDDGADKQC